MQSAPFLMVSFVLFASLSEVLLELTVPPVATRLPVPLYCLTNRYHGKDKKYCLCPVFTTEVMT